MDKTTILSEIDMTLDQLSKNSSALKEIASDRCYEVEAKALRCMQESLLSHLLHLQEHLTDQTRPKPSREKVLLEPVKAPPLAKHIKALAASKTRLKKTKKISL